MTTSQQPHTRENSQATQTPNVFDDPVSYLTALGIESELVEAAPLPAAA